MSGEPDDDVLAFTARCFDLARAGESEQLTAYVDAGLPVNLTNDKGDTLLILAAYHNSPATVRVLLERGADHARVNDRGQTALTAAAFRRSTEGVTALLAAGADPHLGSPSAVEVARFFEGRCCSCSGAAARWARTRPGRSWRSRRRGWCRTPCSGARRER